MSERRKAYEPEDARAVSMRAEERPRDEGPWASVLAEVRRSATRVEWVEERVRREQERELKYEAELGLAEAAGAAVEGREANILALERERREAAEEVRRWMRESRDERRHLSTVSVNAIRSGLAERYVQSVREEGALIARVMARALDAANLDDEQRAAAFAALRTGLGEMTRELDARARATGLPQRELGVG
jgi:hypothetical protein